MDGHSLQNHLVLATVIINFPLTLSKIEAWCEEGSSLSSIMLFSCESCSSKCLFFVHIFLLGKSKNLVQKSLFGMGSLIPTTHTMISFLSAWASLVKHSDRQCGTQVNFRVRMSLSPHRLYSSPRQAESECSVACPPCAGGTREVSCSHHGSSWPH